MNQTILKIKIQKNHTNLFLENEMIKKRKQTEEENFMPTSEEEFQADLDTQDMRYLQYCREQEEMYNDPVMNWSGNR